MMDIFQWKHSFVRSLYRILSSWLILFFLSQCIFPQVDVLAATYRQKMLRMKLSDVFQNTSENPRIKLMAQVLDIIPSQHYRTLLKIDYNPYQTPLPRGMAKDDHLIINAFQIESDEEFISVFIHEIGHVTDLGFLISHENEIYNSDFTYPNRKKVPSSDPSISFYSLSWKDEQNKKSYEEDDFISTYARSNPFEEFAESYNFFVLHGGEFLQKTDSNEILLQKYNFLKKQVFFDRSFDLYAPENYTKIISDTTLLPVDINKFILYSEDKDNKRRVSSRTRVRRTGRTLREILSARFGKTVES